MQKSNILNIHWFVPRKQIFTFLNPLSILSFPFFGSKPISGYFIELLSSCSLCKWQRYIFISFLLTMICVQTHKCWSVTSSNFVYNQINIKKYYNCHAILGYQIKSSKQTYSGIHKQFHFDSRNNEYSTLFIAILTMKRKTANRHKSGNYLTFEAISIIY